MRILPITRTSMPLALAGALLLSACRGDSSPTSAAADSPFASGDAPSASLAPLPQACALLSAEQAQTVLGQPVALMSDDPENCIWSSQGHPGQIAMFMVQISQETSEAEAKTMFDAIVNASGGLNPMVNAGIGAEDRSQAGALTGIGDAAWRNLGNADAIDTRQMVIRKGHRLLNLNVTGMGPVDGLDARLENAARDAIARL
jgi:hypothetical protein